MRALTVKQPWASLIANGTKQIENRTYPVPKTVRGHKVAIHAGKGFDSDWRKLEVFDLCLKHECDAFEASAKAEAGRILCTARIVGQIHPGAEFEFFGKSGGTARDCPECGHIIYWSTEPHCDHCGGSKSKYWQDLEADFYENLPGVYGWILADLKPNISAKIHRGMLGFWTVKGNL